MRRVGIACDDEESNGCEIHISEKRHTCDMCERMGVCQNGREEERWRDFSHLPARTRPARPARCVADAMEMRRVERWATPVRGSQWGERWSPESMTRVT